MKNKTSGIFATIFFTLISILFVSPILIVLMNSFKKKAFISLEPFKLPNEKSYFVAAAASLAHPSTNAFCTNFQFASVWSAA